MDKQWGFACAQDKLHLYFLFDLMPGGDLMDVLVAEARVIKRRIAQGAWKRACFAPKVALGLFPAPTYCDRCIVLMMYPHTLHWTRSQIQAVLGGSLAFSRELQPLTKARLQA